jgi:hypothetical protein
MQQKFIVIVCDIIHKMFILTFWLPNFLNMEFVLSDQDIMNTTHRRIFIFFTGVVPEILGG